jgi:hypothetical protein
MRYTTLIPLGTEIILVLLPLLSSAYNLKNKVEKKKHEVSFHITSVMILDKSENRSCRMTIHSLASTGFSFFQLVLLHYNMALTRNK